MKVDFTSLRIKLGKRYNTLCRIVKQLSLEDDEGKYYDLRETVDALHDLVATFLCLESDAEGEKFEAVEMELFVLGDEEGDN